MNQKDRVKAIRKACAGREFITKSLFVDTKPPHSNAASYYTLYKEPGSDEYPMMKDMYLSFNDPTEYSQAIHLLGNWQHWKMLCTKDWFQKYLIFWREELEVKMRADAIRNLTASERTDAAKWIAEGKWKERRGRPSKDEIQGIQRVHAGIGAEIDELYESATQQERKASLN